MTPAATRVLEVASKLFYERGIHAVGVDTIAEVSGVTKKTIYDRFRSKDMLVAVYLHRRDLLYRRWQQEWAAGHPLDPPLLGTFDAMAAWMREHGPRGCAFVRAAGELPDPDHPAHRIAREHKSWFRDYLRDLAVAAGHPRPADIASELLTLHEGATVLYSVGADPAAVITARRAAALLAGSQR